MDKEPLLDPDCEATLRTRERVAYNYALHQKGASYLSELTLGLLHRFNNVFTGIIFLTDDCLVRAEADPLMRERLDEIASALRLAHSFVDRVVHLHVGEEEDDASYYDVDAVIASELETLSLLLPKGVCIYHRPSGQPVCFYGSKRAVCEILLHLIGNAGAVLEGEGGTVWISAQVMEGDGLIPRVALVIRDNGRGFGPGVLPRIFEPLFTTRGDLGHAGLGLFRAQQLARSTNGDLLARNHPDDGAEFTLVLAQTNPNSTS